MASRTLFLVCNAHLDPVWLWEWEEGLAEALSTFRCAAKLLEAFDGFVFNHNEALLYEWIETHEPALFARIVDLVGRGRWHIMGGWYLQPDCNLPSGESFVRQILRGKRYFLDRFQVEPRTAVNLDSFGHTRGLVQILRKSGYASYLFCRPDPGALSLPREDFVWTGYDGSEILAHRAPDHYNSERGRAGARLEAWLTANPDRRTGLLLWGIGNHGGGASREDLIRIGQIIAAEKTCEIRHGTPEDYFDRIERERDALPRLDTDLNPWAVGCYTTMAEVKQKHRRLENAYYATEKMLANAAVAGVLDYPHEALRDALDDLLFSQFHDVLPGTSIPEVEASSLQKMDHGLEVLSRLRARAFFALLSGHAPAADGEFPILVYNPHPHAVVETVVCELQPPEPNLDRGRFLLPALEDAAGNPVPYQLEKESSNIALDQRKRLVFRAALEPAAMTRFACRLNAVAAPDPPSGDGPAPLTIASDCAEVVVNPETGLIDRYRVRGVDYLKSGAFQALVVVDSADPWGMKVTRFRNVRGTFSLMSGEESADLAGVDGPVLAPVRVIEDGPVRTTVESLHHYRRSTLCLRYRIPRVGSEVEVEVRVYWMEKDRMLKLSLPTCFLQGVCRGEVAYGVEEYRRPGEEVTAQKWVGVTASDRDAALTVINDGTHGLDFAAGELRLTLLRSPAYSGHPVADDIPIVRQDRFEPRIDQGERRFRFWMNAGPAVERLAAVDREALVKNEAPMALCCYPPGTGKPVPGGVSLSDPGVRLAALKMAEDGGRLVLRLFEPTGAARRTTVRVPALDLRFDVSLERHEIKTLGVDLESRAVAELDLLEREARAG
jgi:alpha-mannosidase